MSEAVVARAFVRVAEDLEGFGCLLEALDSLIVALIFVRVVLNSQLAIGGRDLLIRGSALDPEHFVVIALFGHSRHCKHARGSCSQRKTGHPIARVARDDGAPILGQTVPEASTDAKR